jgi:two-component system nitrogen regulation sensor histidine kinase NtrY
VTEKVEAADAEPPFGTVDVTIIEQNGRINVSVADSGVGLPAERERLTEPYMTTRARGTGLGLAIVKNILEEHHATLSFSDREGGGTIVTLSFDPTAIAAVEDDDRGDSIEERPVELTRNRSK